MKSLLILHVVPPDVPILLCEQFKYFYICIAMEKEDLDL